MVTPRYIAAARLGSFLANGERLCQAETGSDPASGLTLQFPSAPAMICRIEAKRAAAPQISAVNRVLIDDNRQRVKGLT
jgi:hypothetical protein